MAEAEGMVGVERLVSLEAALAQERKADGAMPERGLLAEALLADADALRASDVHLDPRTGTFVIRLRIDGEVQELGRVAYGDGLRLVNQFKALADLDPGHSTLPRHARCSYRLGERVIDFRLTVAPCIAGPKLALRLLDPGVVEHRISELGLSAEARDRVEEWLATLRGMFLVTGPTGSGKTTTLYALLHELKAHSRNIVTLEDPVEYQIDGINQIQVNEHGLDFPAGLGTMLRLDPDYLLIGEIRDRTVAHLAVEMAVKGRVLLSSIHALDPVGAITTLREWALRDHEIATVLSVVVAQQLVRVLCPECRRRQRLSAADAEWFRLAGMKPPASAFVATGCPACGGTGYHGRTGVFELWYLDEEAYRQILDHADEHRLRAWLASRGHRSLLHQGLDKVLHGMTSMQELKRFLPALKLRQGTAAR